MSQNRFYATNPQTLIEKAEKLSQKLYANQIPSARIHEKILKLDELYMHILSNDKKKLFEDLSSSKRPLFDIIKKLLTYQPVENEDNDIAAKIDSPESKHIQDYFKFLKACSDYANYIKKHLLRMRADLGEQSIPALSSITADMDLNDVLDLHKNVMDEIAKNPSASYEKHAKLLALIKFVNPVSPITALFKSHLAVTGELHKSGHKVLSSSSIKHRY